MVEYPMTKEDYACMYVCNVCGRLLPEVSLEDNDNLCLTCWKEDLRIFNEHYKTEFEEFTTEINDDTKSVCQYAHAVYEARIHVETMKEHFPLPDIVMHSINNHCDAFMRYIANPQPFNRAWGQHYYLEAWTDFEIAIQNRLIKLYGEC